MSRCLQHLMSTEGIFIWALPEGCSQLFGSVLTVSRAPGVRGPRDYHKGHEMLNRVHLFHGSSSLFQGVH